MTDLHQLRNKFAELYRDEPQFFSAPGRVNLIGEHTDYNEGFVLPFAIDRRTFVAASARNDGQIKVFSQTLDDYAEFSVDENVSADEKNWTLYIKGMSGILRRRGVNLRGANLLIDSEIPFGAGLSSSAALEISVGLALSFISGAKIEITEIAFAGQAVEHEFVGVKSGIMDQFASALARKNHALLIDCRSFETRQIPLLLPDAALIVCDSKVKHELAAGEYNLRRAECERGAAILRSKMPEIKSLRDVSFADFLKFQGDLPEIIRKRCRHVITENARTLAAVSALEKNDAVETGNLMFASHASLRDDYQVSSAELDALVEIARQTQIVFGARMTGGGFGGCTINLVRRDAVRRFREIVGGEYKSVFGFEPTVYEVEPSDGAGALKSANEN